MSDQESTAESEWLMWLLFVALAFALGMVPLGMFLDPLRFWMLQNHLLEQGGATVIPIVDGVGLGWGQILVVAAAITGTVVLLWWWFRRRSHARV